MTPLLWIAFAFVLLVLIFLMVAFFAGKHMSEQQHNVLKVLSALCTAFAGGLITGEALFKMEGTFEAGPKYLISGTSGFALFLVVWFFFPKYPKSYVLQDGCNLSIPKGWTLRHTVDVLAQQDGAVPDYTELTDAELAAPLKPWHIKAKNTSDAIGLLRSVAEDPRAIRKYDVTFDQSTYRLRPLNPKR